MNGGLELAEPIFFQAPSSMKSVLQSFWLLTVAFGDLIVVILASVMPALGVVSNLIFSMQ